jgi:hypothetical protein
VRERGRRGGHDDDRVRPGSTEAKVEGGDLETIEVHLVGAHGEGLVGDAPRIVAEVRGPVGEDRVVEQPPRSVSVPPVRSLGAAGSSDVITGVTRAIGIAAAVTAAVGVGVTVPTATPTTREVATE